MAECIKCEISDEKAILYDAISKEGIVKICRKCNLEENLPLVHQVKKEEGIERERNVYERLSKYAGINPEEHRRKFKEGGEIREDLTEKQNKSLKNLVDENYQKKIPKEKPKRDDLIYNFHWVIMRERRKKKLTQSQLAREIQEPKQAIKMIEQGYVPEEGGEKLILKLENFLKINISKKPISVSDETRYREIDPTKIQIEREFQKQANFDNLTTRHLTISDLKRMKEQQSQEGSKSISTSSESGEVFLDPFSDEIPEKETRRQRRRREKRKDEPDLSPEEIERIIYGGE
jgi:ribosome-binding protein aMBF1 (putative translation factor)